MYVYYLTASLCLTNIPAECQIVWERGPIKTFPECQKAVRNVPASDSWNKLTCWFRPIRRT